MVTILTSFHMATKTETSWRTVPVGDTTLTSGQWHDDGHSCAQHYMASQGKTTMVGASKANFSQHQAWDNQKNNDGQSPKS